MKTKKKHKHRTKKNTKTKKNVAYTALTRAWKAPDSAITGLTGTLKFTKNSFVPDVITSSQFWYPRPIVQLSELRMTAYALIAALGKNAFPAGVYFWFHLASPDGDPVIDILPVANVAGGVRVANFVDANNVACTVFQATSLVVLYNSQDSASMPGAEITYAVARP